MIGHAAEDDTDGGENSQSPGYADLHGINTKSGPIDQVS